MLYNGSLKVSVRSRGLLVARRGSQGMTEFIRFRLF